MKPIVIKICRSNEIGKKETLLRELLSLYEHVELHVEECLNRCSFCDDNPYVLINNGIEFGDDLEELLQNIKNELLPNRKV